MSLVDALVPLSGKMETVRLAQLAAYNPAAYKRRVRARFLPTRLTLESHASCLQEARAPSLPSRIIDRIVASRAEGDAARPSSTAFAQPEDYAALAAALEGLEVQIRDIQQSCQGLSEACAGLDGGAQTPLGPPLRCLWEAVARLEAAAGGLGRREAAMADVSAVLERVPRLHPLIHN